MNETPRVHSRCLGGILPEPVLFSRGIAGLFLLFISSVFMSELSGKGEQKKQRMPLIKKIVEEEVFLDPSRKDIAL
jgi:hypothetical protein